MQQKYWLILIFVINNADACTHKSFSFVYNLCYLNIHILLFKYSNYFKAYLSNTASSVMKKIVKKQITTANFLASTNVEFSSFQSTQTSLRQKTKQR